MKIHIDKAILQQSYAKHGTIAKVAEDLGYGYNVTRRRMIDCGIACETHSKLIISKEKLEALYNKHKSVVGVAKELKIDRHTVSRRLAKYNITKVSRQPALSVSVSKEKLKALYDKHQNLSAVGRELGCTYATVAWRMNKYNLPYKQNKQYQHTSEIEGFSKELLESKYLELGKSSDAVGELLGCDGSTILRALTKYGSTVHIKYRADIDIMRMLASNFMKNYIED